MFANQQMSNQCRCDRILALISNCIYLNQRFVCTGVEVPTMSMWFTIDLLYSINRASDQSYILNKVGSAGFFVCLFACLFFILPI